MTEPPKKQHFIFLTSVCCCCFLFYFCYCSRCALAVDCEVSLPQHSTLECTAVRNVALAKLKETFTLKPDSHGFARLNMNFAELAAVSLQDPFTRYYTQAYFGMSQTNNKTFEQYINTNLGQEIADLSDYLKMSEFFQTALEPVLGVNITFFTNIQ